METKLLLQLDGLEHELRAPARDDKFTLTVNESLKVRAGSFISILGDNGCGKTTLLSLLGLLREPDKVNGVFQVNGKDISNLRSRKKEKYLESLRRQFIGFALQSGELLPTLTVAENIAVPMRLNGIGQKESSKRIKELLEIFEIVGKSHARINTLSGGEYQRVVLARAIAHSPNIVFVDEPTSALHRKRAELALRLLKETALEKPDTAIVMVTHDQKFAEYFSDWIVDMAPVDMESERGGKKQAAGTIIAIRSNSPQEENGAVSADNPVFSPRKSDSKLGRARYYTCLTWTDVYRERASWLHAFIIAACQFYYCLD